MISVCLATFNGEKFIKSQIESILIQLNDNDELIISDDQSTDNTVAIVRKINDPRIQIYYNEKKHVSSPSAFATKNFENALSKSKGDIIFLSDQDDVWLPNKIEVMISYLETYDMVISDAYITDINLEIVHDTRFYPGCGQTQNLYKAYISTHPYQGSCMAFNRKVLAKALPFPKPITSHDTWLGYLGATFFKVKLAPEKLMYYRRHSDVVSITGEKSKRPLVYKLFNRLKYLSMVIMRGCGLI